LHAIESSSANEWTTKPSGAPGSIFTDKLRSFALWPGPGQLISLPLASPPSALAKFCGSITLMDGSSVRSAAAKTSDQGWCENHREPHGKAEYLDGPVNPVCDRE